MWNFVFEGVIERIQRIPKHSIKHGEVFTSCTFSCIFFRQKSVKVPWVDIKLGARIEEYLFNRTVIFCLPYSYFRSEAKIILSFSSGHTWRRVILCSVVVSKTSLGIQLHNLNFKLVLVGIFLKSYDNAYITYYCTMYTICRV